MTLHTNEGSQILLNSDGTCFSIGVLCPTRMLNNPINLFSLQMFYPTIFRILNTKSKIYFFLTPTLPHPHFLWMIPCSSCKVPCKIWIKLIGLLIYVV